MKKHIGDVVFIDDARLGFTSNNKNLRPCVIIEIKNNIYYLVHMTTKTGFKDDPNRKQLQITCGSYIKLNQKPHEFTEKFINNCEIPSYNNAYKYKITFDEIQKIKRKVMKN